jgi:hypothetical protein
MAESTLVRTSYIGGPMAESTSPVRASVIVVCSVVVPLRVVRVVVCLQ